SPGLEVVLLPDALSRDRLADFQPVLRMDKGHIVNDEDTGLVNPLEIVDHFFGTDCPIAASVERPGAAERTVPGTTPAEFHGCARIEHADEIPSSMADRVARWAEVVKALHKHRRLSRAVVRHDARALVHGAAIVLDGEHQGLD